MRSLAFHPPSRCAAADDDHGAGDGRKSDLGDLARRAADPLRGLCFTTAAGRWQDRLWETDPATIHPTAGGTEGRASAVIPAGATAWYLNLVDEAGLVVSGEHAVR